MLCHVLCGVVCSGVVLCCVGCVVLCHVVCCVVLCCVVSCVEIATRQKRIHNDKDARTSPRSSLPSAQQPGCLLLFQLAQDPLLVVELETYLTIS